ncbi:MAG TPA: peptidase S10, partial [Anaerolineae bacterium]|nr:peptidase S10 [Anaerolineae bacterium]
MSTDTTPTPQPTPEDNLVTTHHTLTLNDQTLAYTATTGTILLHDEPQKEGKEEGRVPKTSIFFTAYTRDNTKLEQRPIIFAFNGGPGSSSVWLHMGLLGPYRVSLPADNTFAPPPFQLIPNQHTLLDHAD